MEFLRPSPSQDGNKEHMQYPFAREDGNSFWLTANCCDVNGQYREASIDLANYLGNNNGQLQWGSKGFAQKLRGWSLNFPTLTVSLMKSALETVESKVDLLEKITVNKDGALVYDDNVLKRRATYRNYHPADAPVTPIRFLWTRNMCALIKGSHRGFRYDGPKPPDEEVELDAQEQWRLLASTPTRANTHTKRSASSQSCVTYSKNCTAFLKLEADPNNTLWRGDQAVYFRERRWLDLANTSAWYKFPAGAGPGPSSLSLDPAKQVFSIGMRPSDPAWDEFGSSYLYSAKFNLASTDDPKKDDRVAIVDLVDESDGTRVYVKVVTWERAWKMQKADHQGEKMIRVPEPPNLAIEPIPREKFVPITLPPMDPAMFAPIPATPAAPPPVNQPAVSRFLPPGLVAPLPTLGVPAPPVIPRIPPIIMPKFNFGQR